MYVYRELGLKTERKKSTGSNLPGQCTPDNQIETPDWIDMIDIRLLVL